MIEMLMRIDETTNEILDRLKDDDDDMESED